MVKQTKLIVWVVCSIKSMEHIVGVTSKTVKEMVHCQKTLSWSQNSPREFRMTFLGRKEQQQQQQQNKPLPLEHVNMG